MSKEVSALFANFRKKQDSMEQKDNKQITNKEPAKREK